MKELLGKLTDAYASALRAYLDGQGEAALLRAYDVGREAVAEKLSVLELTAVHQVALVRTLLDRLPPEERERIETLASDFSSESLVPFELTARGAREANAMLQQLNETLEAKNAEIRRQLAELRALQALKDDLMALIVHDLRNPLAGMVSCLDLLQPSKGDPRYEDTREIVQLAREGTRKLTELIEDLLEVQTLEDGNLAIRREPVDLVAVARDAIGTLESSARLEEVRLEPAVAGPGVAESGLEVTGDVRLLRRAAENLISNAIRFSTRGGAVTVTCRRDAAGIALDVSDRGPGLTDEARARLFQKFGSVGTKGGRRGFGLGLYFVKLVATAHGGGVEALERAGGGTTFRIALPRP